MLLQLIQYYSFVLKNGNPKPDYPPLEVPYGRAEIKMNQHWYGFTALALVCGLAIGVSGILLAFQKAHQDKRNVLSSPVCCFCPLMKDPKEDQRIFRYDKGKLSLGTKVKLSSLAFQIPKPFPKEKIIQAGVRNDKKILDPQSDSTFTCESCKFTLPEIPEPEEEAFIYPNEPGCSCCSPVDEKPHPVNLNKISQLITYPGLLQGKGGTVVVHVLVNKNGRYSRHKILHSDHPKLLASIEEQINKLKFTPAIEGGRPINFWVKIPFAFKAIGELTEFPIQKPVFLDYSEHIEPSPAQFQKFFSEEAMNLEKGPSSNL